MSDNVRSFPGAGERGARKRPPRPRGDRVLAALIVIIEAGERTLCALAQIAIYLLAAIGALSLLR